MWQLFHPFSLCIIQPLLESIYYDFVNSLGLSIPLEVSYGRVSVCNSQITAISPKGFAIELETIIRDEGMRNPKPCDNVFLDKLLGVHNLDICQGFGFNPLSEVIRAD